MMTLLNIVLVAVWGAAFVVTGDSGFLVAITINGVGAAICFVLEN